jgi:hypothetical protein
MAKRPASHKSPGVIGLKPSGAKSLEDKSPKDKSSQSDVFDAKQFLKDRDAFIEMLSQNPEFESCW